MMSLDDLVAYAWSHDAPATVEEARERCRPLEELGDERVVVAGVGGRRYRGHPARVLLELRMIYRHRLDGCPRARVVDDSGADEMDRLDEATLFWVPSYLHEAEGTPHPGIQPLFAPWIHAEQAGMFAQWLGFAGETPGSK